jgi:hypothetical protein
VVASYQNTDPFKSFIKSNLSASGFCLDTLGSQP